MWKHNGTSHQLFILIDDILSYKHPSSRDFPATMNLTWVAVGQHGCTNSNGTQGHHLILGAETWVDRSWGPGQTVAGKPCFNCGRGWSQEKKWLDSNWFKTSQTSQNWLQFLMLFAWFNKQYIFLRGYKQRRPNPRTKHHETWHHDAACDPTYQNHSNFIYPSGFNIAMENHHV